MPTPAPWPLLAAFLTLCALPVGAGQPARVQARDGWVREAPLGRPNTTAYVTLENQGPAGVEIVGVTTTVARVAELHEMRDDNGVMRMRKVERVVVPPGSVVDFKPGGYHIMLIDLTKAIVAGDRVPVVLRFADGTSMPFEATARGVAVPK